MGYRQMEKGRSPSQVVKQLDAQIYRILKKSNIRSLSNIERKVATDLQQNLIDSRIYATAYEFSETREEQVKNSVLGKKWLGQLRKNILTLSEHNIFDAVDVAHLTAQVDQVISDMK
jgi:hypothetical protein